jgi:hypothetical protein
MKFNRVCMLALLAMTACGAETGGADENLAKTSEALDFSTTWSGKLNVATPDVAAVSRGTNLLDFFTIINGALRYERYDSGWDPNNPVSLGKPAGVARLDAVAASTSGGRIDVFAVGSDNKIWHRFTTSTTTGSPTWDASWHGIVNTPTVRAASDIAVASWGTGRLDLFWWTPSNHLGHAFADGFVWGGTETGDTASKTYLQRVAASEPVRGLTVVATKDSRLDIFYSTGSTAMGHHWFDGAINGWGATNKKRFQVISINLEHAVSVSGIAAAPLGANQLEVFVFGQRSQGQGIYRATSNNGLWPTSGDPTAINFSTVEHSETPDIELIGLDAALRWNSGSRLDLFAGNGFDLWQAYRE